MQMIISLCMQDTHNIHDDYVIHTTVQIVIA